MLAMTSLSGEHCALPMHLDHPNLVHAWYRRVIVAFFFTPAKVVLICHASLHAGKDRTRWKCLLLNFFLSA